MCSVHALSEGGLSAILNVQEAIFVLLLFVHRAHQRCVGWDRIGTKQEQSLLGSQFDAFSNDIVKLPHSQVGWYQVFLFVNVRNVRPIGLFANDGDAVGILGANALCFRLSLFFAQELALAGKGEIREALERQHSTMQY